MNTKHYRWPAAGLLSVALLGCGINWLLPDWQRNVGDYTGHSYLFPTRDGQSLVNADIDYRGTHVTVRRLDLTGNTVATLDQDTGLDNWTSRGMVRGSQDDFYIFSSNPAELIYVDPASETVRVGTQTGLPANQTLRISDWYPNAPRISPSGQLVVGGYITTDPDSEQPERTSMVGLINQQGQLEQNKRLPDLENIAALQPLSGDRFLLVAKVRQGEAASKVFAFIELDANLNQLQRTDRTFDYFNFTALVHDRIVAEVADASATGTRVLDTSGATLQSISLYRPTTNTLIAAREGFFSVDYTKRDTGRWNTPVICYYDGAFTQKWCRELGYLNMDEMNISSAIVTPENELLLTIDTDHLKLLGTTLTTDAAIDSIKSGLTFQGEQKRELVHVLYNTAGQRVAGARAGGNVERGNVSLCWTFELCVEPAEYEPGYCGGYGQSIALPGRNVYSTGSYCEKRQGEWTEHLWHWQP